MALKYTTEDAIMQRLEGRLEHIGPTALGATVVNSALLSTLAAQAEARLDNALRAKYQLPLQDKHPTLAEFVELRVICTIIPIYFQGGGISDDRGMANPACKEAIAILTEITNGAITLPGEREAIAFEPNPAQSTIARQREPGVAEGLAW